MTSGTKKRRERIVQDGELNNKASQPESKAQKELENAPAAVSLLREKSYATIRRVASARRHTRQSQESQ